MASDCYDEADKILMPWAQAHNIRVGTLFRDDPVRSVWVYDRLGNQRAQLWLGVPTTDQQITVFAARFDPDAAEKWTAREQRTVAVSELDGALEELRHVIFEWAGPGAFT
jgi:hypothetical protein